MLRAVVSEQQDDWDDHLPAVLSAYHSTPHSSTGLSPYRMVYGVEMTMPIDLVIGEVGQQRPNVHCPVEYVEWLKGSIRDAHTLARENLKKATKRQKKGYGEASQNVCFQRGDWVWRVYPPVSGGKLHYKNRGPWLVLAKVSSVTYKIQRHTGAEPEIVHVDKLMPYQADFGEELESWLQNEDSGGHRVKGTQTPTPVPTEASPGVTDGPSNEVTDRPFDPGLEDGYGADIEGESLSESAAPPRRSQRPRQEPDRYTEVWSVRSVVSTTDSLGPSLLFLVGVLLVVVVVLNPDVAVMAVVAVAAVVSMFFSPQLMLPWTRWWAGHR